MLLECWDARRYLLLKLFLDENIGLNILINSFDVKNVHIMARGASDEEIIRLAKDENRDNSYNG